MKKNTYMRLFFHCMGECDFDVVFMHNSNIICQQRFQENNTCFGAYFGTYKTHTYVQYDTIPYLNYSVHLGNSSIPFSHSEYQRPIIFQPGFPRPRGIRHAVHSHYFLVRFAVLAVLCVIALAILRVKSPLNKDKHPNPIKASKLSHARVDKKLKI